MELGCPEKLTLWFNPFFLSLGLFFLWKHIGDYGKEMEVGEKASLAYFAIRLD